MPRNEDITELILGASSLVDVFFEPSFRPLAPYDTFCHLVDKRLHRRWIVGRQMPDPIIEQMNDEFLIMLIDSGWPLKIWQGKIPGSYILIDLDTAILEEYISLYSTTNREWIITKEPTTVKPLQLIFNNLWDRSRTINHESFGIIDNKNDSRIIILPRVSINELQTLLTNPSDLQKCSPRFFEELVAELLRADGWSVELVARNNAPGPDIIALSTKYLNNVQIKMIVECKKWSPESPVDIDVVRKVMYWVNEEYRATLGMIATTSRFTSVAVDQAFSNHRWRLDLRDQSSIINWIHRCLYK